MAEKNDKLSIQRKAFVERAALALLPSFIHGPIDNVAEREVALDDLMNVADALALRLYPVEVVAEIPVPAVAA